MEANGAQGRVLADDMMLSTMGEAHAKQFEHAFDLTHKYLDEMGAKIAAKKSMARL